MERKDVLSLLDKKRRGIDNTSYERLSNITGYSKRQLIRLYKQLEEEGIEEVSIHKSRGSTSHNKASKSELEFIKEFKAQYPKITIAHFKDIYEEDVVLNDERKEDVLKYDLKVRSYSFYQSLYRRYDWKSPIKHKKKINDNKYVHLIRKPSEYFGHLVQIDGTPHDWFEDGNKYTLHLAVDDATSKVLAGYFTKNECIYGYCQMMKIMLIKYGIPVNVYSDKHTIFKGLDDNVTIFGQIIKDLGINAIYANTPQAKGRVERSNKTYQNRLINDIKRFKNKGVKLNGYDDLNIWFNDFYCDYLNKKFSYAPLNPNDEFVSMDDNYNYDQLFSIRFTRVIETNSMFSFNSYNYTPIDKNGEILYIRKGVKINLRFEILTNRLTTNRYGIVYECINIGPNSKGRRKNTVDNIKELRQLLDELDNKNKTK